MKTMSDRDAVWLGILRRLRRRDLQGKTAGQVRRILRADGFPERVIKAWLDSRKPAR